MDNVAVIMSTYNGEKYLREQLDSILGQVNVSVTLYVRDDGSVDETKQILSEYAKHYDSVHVEFAQNVGVGNSFMNALYATPDTFDYYAFADQDDIWLENKLYEAVKTLKDSGANLYVSNQECVNGEGKSLGLRWLPDDERVFLNPEGILCQNVLCGCTMALTKQFKRIICKEDKRPAPDVLNLKNHDGWIALVAAMGKGIVYDNRSFMKYRQHGANVVGAYKASFGKRLRAKFRKIKHNELRNYRSKTARELCLKCPELTCKYPIIEMCAVADTRKGKRQILKNQKELRRYANEGRSNFWLKVIFGLF